MEFINKHKLTLKENVFLAKNQLVGTIYKQARMENINITFPQTKVIFEQGIVGVEVLVALEHDLETVPVINKIDLPSADIALAKQEIETKIGLSTNDVVCVSGKTGAGIDEMLEKVVELVPPPSGDSEGPLGALIFDSYA